MMNRFAWILTLSMVTPFGTRMVSADDAATTTDKEQNVPELLDRTMTSLAGGEVKLSKYHGQVLLIVNVASKCGYTPQYEPLQELHTTYGEKGLAVLGFPCNQFGGQEPGSAEQISQFCHKNYGVTFDMFGKVDVNGKDACGLYKELTSKETNPEFAGPIRWNFEKFLIGRDGSIVARYPSGVSPTSPKVLKAIEAELAKPDPTDS